MKRETDLGSLADLGVIAVALGVHRSRGSGIGYFKRQRPGVCMLKGSEGLADKKQT